ISEFVEYLSGGSLILMLVLVAFMSLILGMGLPTTANYIVVSSLMAPVIVTLGAANGLVVPLIAVHLFVFYFGILADDTPPVGLAAFAAAAISGGDPIKTGVQGFMYDIRTALLPFLFIFNTELLLIDVTWWKAIFVFITAVVGSGLGWLVVLFGVQTPDLVIPEAYPLYSAFTNVHFPLAIALLAVIAGVLVMAFRPGFSDDPTVQNGGLTVILSSFLLALIAPHALVPLPLAAAAVIAVDWVRRRKIYVYQFRWFMLLVLPAVPVAGYYVAEMRYNDAVGLWMAQNVTLTPLPHIFLAGFALPLIVALPAIIRAVRNYEPDGDQFMLWWLIAFLVMVYVPTSAQRRFAIGMMLPIAYFAVRALNDYWLHDRKEKVKGRLLAAFYGLSGISYVLLFLLWFQAAGSTTDPRFYLNDGYFRAFSWLQREADDDAVVLASEAVGLWVPGHAGMSTVYGHPYETLLADVRQQDVRDWYAAGSAADAICTSLVERDNVQYVVVGPLERPDGATPACIETLTEVQQFGDVTLYEP
ncbi:MAG: TRAP transporter large permease subunit, partial [Chloroflexota bacterium]